ELPGLPTSPRQQRLPESQASTQRTAIPTYEHDDSIPPPVPPKPTCKSVESKGDPHLVTFNPCDVANTANWSRGKKWLSTSVFSLIGFCVAFASTVDVSAAHMTAIHFHTSDEVLLLDRALYMGGIAIGSVVWTSVSDRYGRRAPMFLGYVAFLLFQIPVAVAKNLATICICRLLAGFFGCSALATVPLAMRDIWEPSRRSMAMSLLTVAIIAGPAMAALFSGYIVQNRALGWRWPSWIVLISGVLLGLCSWMFSAETSSSFILRRKAKKLRRSTGDWALHAATDDPEMNFAVISENYICRPLALLLTEPILFFITLYVSYAYGLLYLLVETFPFTYGSERRWTLSAAGLPFLAVLSGVLLGSFIASLFLSNRHILRLKNCHGPEDLFLAFLVGSAALPIGLFLFGWTSARQISSVPQIASGVFLGAGIFLVFLQGNNYLLEVYSSSNSSAVIAVSTSIRSIVAASFCAFARPMLKGMSVEYASTLLAIVSIILMPIPVVLFKIGVKVRAMSNCTAKLPGSSHGSDGKC
ncbi:Citrinin biosynthesis cluster MFS transporter mrr1, partial [Pseudocercospora fuligena]